MLKLLIKEDEAFIDDKFIKLKETTLTLEHSLVSVSKWESKFEKPFMSEVDKTDEELMYYIQCMTITQNVKLDTFFRLTEEHFQAIKDYIDAPMTATRINKDNDKQPNGTFITTELIYYNMIAYNIPFECQKWHLNRLLMLIDVCHEKQKPPEKMDKAKMLARRNQLNDMRRKQHNSKG